MIATLIMEGCSALIVEEALKKYKEQLINQRVKFGPKFNSGEISRIDEMLEQLKEINKA